MPPSDHRHCKTCGRTVDPEDEVCSPECADKRRRLRETRRNTTYMMYGLMAFLVLLLLVGYVR